MIPVKQYFIKISIFLYQKTGGLLGHRLGTQRILLLQTIGRKSGKKYTSPLAYFKDGENYLVIASNWGSENPPNWFQNLEKTPKTTIQVGRQIFWVESKQAEGLEYGRLWEAVTQQSPFYANYQKKMKRSIPIVILSPELFSNNPG